MRTLWKVAAGVVIGAAVVRILPNKGIGAVLKRIPTGRTVSGTILMTLMLQALSKHKGRMTTPSTSGAGNSAAQ